MGRRLLKGFDVIIVNYRTYEGLKKALCSLFDLAEGLVNRVFVVDNESDSAFLNEFRREFPCVDFWAQEKNLGFARAVNLALENGASEFVMLLNPDAFLKTPIFQNALHIFEEDETVAVIGPGVLDPDGTIQGSARGDPGLLTAFFGRTGLFSRLFPKSRFVARDVVAPDVNDRPRVVDWVSGACMMVRRRAIDRVGPLDERFFMYWEDCDWCRRFRQEGFKVVYAPGVGDVVHACGDASKRRPFRSIYHFHKSAFLLYAKYDRSPFKMGTLVASGGALLRGLMALAIEGCRMLGQKGLEGRKKGTKRT